MTWSARDKTRVNNPLTLFIYFFGSKLGCFDFFRKKMSQLGLTLPARDLGFALG